MRFPKTPVPRKLPLGQSDCSDALHSGGQWVWERAAAVSVTAIAVLSWCMHLMLCAPGAV